MSDERHTIFHRLGEARKKIPGPTPYPAYDAEILTARPRLTGESLWGDFARNLRAMHGHPLDCVEDLVAFLLREDARVGYVDPALAPIFDPALRQADIRWTTVYERRDYDDYQFGITRASAGIAETGSIVLTDTHTSDRLAALTPWIHVAVLHPGDLKRTLSEAIGSFGDEGNVIWVTGPSKTADVEGILIEGVHGPGEQICLLSEDCPKLTPA